jgi:NADP-dependent 3-hydroxy acid dehydrogenase YdfG
VGAKTIFITGASSGFGRETAMLFSQKGWRVIATMKDLEKSRQFKEIENIHCFELDITDVDQIKTVVTQSFDVFKTIDAVLNNAGYCSFGPLEGASKEQIYEQFNTNVFGLIEVSKAIIPFFREQGHGRIINISSASVKVPVPLMSLYVSTKWAIDGISEVLHRELSPFNIKVVVIQPGIFETEIFDEGKLVFLNNGDMEPYRNQINHVISFSNLFGQGHPAKVAKVILKAATTKRKKFRYVIGKDARILYLWKRMIGEQMFTRFMTAMSNEKSRIGKFVKYLSRNSEPLFHVNGYFD